MSTVSVIEATNLNKALIHSCYEKATLSLVIRIAYMTRELVLSTFQLQSAAIMKGALIKIQYLNQDLEKKSRSSYSLGHRFSLTYVF